ncbi:hypothetical protein [Thiohalocapsa halophila]|uniref:hypothetical protein n=1 Tax=Thiohalocapsa halophila TaxID=69359 RepID=UPI001908BE29|nr:hypothetical protein [Thiohalocapsa halophila]
MLEALAIAALVVGGVSTATVVTDDQAVEEADRQQGTVEMQQEQPKQGKTTDSENPFRD